MTCSIGFRAPAAAELARELLMRLADETEEEGTAWALYRDPGQSATETPGLLPKTLLAYARAAVAKQLADRDALPRVLGELLTEPKPQVWFEGDAGGQPGAVQLDARSRMLYDARHVYLNGEALRAAGRDARLMRRLADARCLSAVERARLSPEAAALLDGWIAAGWLHGGETA